MSDVGSDLGEVQRERASFFGALEDLGGFGALGDGDVGLGSTALVNAKKAIPQWDGTVFVDSDGVYKYSANADQSFTIKAAPADKSKLIGKKIAKGGAGYAEILAQYDAFIKGKEDEAAGIRKKSRETTAAAMLKGFNEALPSFISTAAAATAPAPGGSGGSGTQKKDDEGGWGALQWGLLVGGIVVAGGVSFLIYRAVTSSSGSKE